jgi:hypothetical protein
MLDLVNFKTLEAQAIPTCVDCDAKKALRQARALFAKGDYAKAEKLYNQIPKGSDVWFDAVEERGWSHFRRDDFEGALAQTKTLLSPQFSGVAELETYLLQSLTELKICDYAGVLETDRNFKKAERSRIVDIQNLSKSGMNASFQEVLSKADQFPLRFTDFGEALTHLPLQFYRDRALQGDLLKLKISQAGMDSIPAGTHAKIVAQFKKMNSDSLSRLQSRMKILAQQENAKNAKVIQKLNLVEVEAIQRIHTDMEISKNLYKKGEFKEVTDDQLVFMDDGHPWIDELDKFDVSAKTCAQGIRRKM